MTLFGCRCSHMFHCLSDPISFNMCRSDPVLSGTSSIVTTGIGAGEIVALSANEKFITVADCQSSRH